MVDVGSEGVPLVETRNLTRIIDGEIKTTLVRDINLCIDRGELVAVMGPSGSGKSSLLYLLGLLDLPTSGEVLINGRATSKLSAGERARMRLSDIGFVFQFHFLLPEFTAVGNVMLPMRALGMRREAEARERAGELLVSLGLAGHEHKLPGQLSGGQRQRVAIARALANDPALILADEPTGNLDSASGDQVMGIFRELAETTGRTILIVTHDQLLAERMDRTVLLVDGQLVPEQHQAAE